MDFPKKEAAEYGIRAPFVLHEERLPWKILLIGNPSESPSGIITW